MLRGCTGDTLQVLHVMNDGESREKTTQLQSYWRNEAAKVQSTSDAHGITVEIACIAKEGRTVTDTILDFAGQVCLLAHARALASLFAAAHAQ